MPQLELVRAKAQMVKSMEEYYNSIRTNIQFSGRDLKVITLTSAQSGEGKSTTSVNLAISFARAGFRTLLIDADTRNSVMSGTFKSKERYDGLTSYLSGNAELSDVIYDTTVDNLMVIPAGQVPPNPTSLIQNDNFKSMIETVRGLYDYVIIDTPPLGLVIDAAILAHHSDASLLVVKAGADKRRTITKLKEQLEQSGSVFLGVILNKYDIHLDKYGSYGSYGGYGSYGNYGKSDEKSKNGRGKRKK
ncbi:capsular polysaccharide biosynthesis protein CpsD [Streptococcus infantarius subsp. infantarius]|nr:capsular polysaccharide biosynthesis protein CpsD [Streptococcus infantarius subsp. infantarius]MCO4489668.1 capsular polysaccharide biosynthesis protein CpsD [Streptococcus infantarius subsp. infantarius]MCO4492237.1 capsular polysaccharide biosynthesis protein CpsD [Streptococcus infantarius subsp. infantarius]MCO4507935.1 capsular polysaccharide biosynthesis protein CpsD [Streptococcus infantarius subsp. infantarius]MCO4509408.1 capsular polysaccharide biosynthesis protein CpsD [Streptoco